MHGAVQLPIVFLVSAGLMMYIPDFAALPFVHLFTVSLLWLKWRLSHPSTAAVARSAAAKKRPGGKPVAGVDKVTTVFSSDEDGSSSDSDSDDEEEVYYAARKPAAAATPRPPTPSPDDDDPVAEDQPAAEEAEEEEEEEEEEAVASTWKRVNELLLIGDLNLQSKLWTEAMDDWETVEQAVRRYPQKLPVAGGLLVHESAEQRAREAAEEAEAAKESQAEERID
jgi:hypothetical protein